VIAKAGQPLVRLTPVAAQRRPRQPGFLAEQTVLHADLKRDFKAEINAMFGQTTDQ
jgi:antitoxin (DNA-binding transcriptional repressor) of toxin-antitoxin stability system